MEAKNIYFTCLRTLQFSCRATVFETTARQGGGSVLFLFRSLRLSWPGQHGFRRTRPRGTSHHVGSGVQLAGLPQQQSYQLSEEPPRLTSHPVQNLKEKKTFKFVEKYKQTLTVEKEKEKRTVNLNKKVN